MKKNRINAFTLVEMLIVIVIIGILIAALMPRMQSAQGRARDVARKNDLAQIQTAIVTSQQDKGRWPGIEGTTGATSGIPISNVSDLLITAGMSSVPKDPLESTKFKGLGNNEITGGQYGYIVAKRNGTKNGGFVLMAKTEIEGGSNWIVCESGSSDGLSKGRVKSDGTVDIKDIHPCTSFTKHDGASDCATSGASLKQGECIYNNDGELRYILVY